MNPTIVTAISTAKTTSVQTRFLVPSKSISQISSLMGELQDGADFR
jgi:hypothetical protein